jgi:hypothetical protein
MTRLLISATIALAGACTTAAQSARVVDPGKTQVTAAITRTTLSGDGVGESDEPSAWNGEIMARHGIGRQFDAGLRLARIPGAETVSSLVAEPKFQITAPESQTTFSVALPVGIGWADELDDGSGHLYLITPMLLLGQALSPTLEVVLAPRVFILIPSEDDADSEVELGGSVGVRFHNEARTWGIQPEIGYVRFSPSDESGSVNFLTFGVSISAGN